MKLVILALDLYAWLIIGRALSSWFTNDRSNPIIRFLHVTTEPVLEPLRKIVSPSALGGIDLSPILVIVLIQLLKYFLVGMA